MQALVKAYCLPIVIGFATAAALNAAEPIRPGISFEKNSQVVLEIGPAESFDACQAKYPSILKVGDEWWMWYHGRSKDSFLGD